jgi:hypothetical protein
VRFQSTILVSTAATLNIKVLSNHTMPPKKPPTAAAAAAAAASLKPPPIGTDILQFRLDTGNMGKLGGQRASLTKCAQALGICIKATSAVGNDRSALQTSKQELKRELHLFELEMTKLLLLQQQREKQVQVNAKILKEREVKITHLQQTVQESSKQAHHALSQQHARQEYDAIAKLILEQHPISQQNLMQKIGDIKQQSQQVDVELSKTNKAMQLRGAQFQLLFQYMNDLKRSLQEEEGKKTSGKRKRPTDNDNTDHDAMDMGDELYGDLSNSQRKDG